MQNPAKQELVERFVELAELLNRRMHSGRLDEWEGLDMTIPQIKSLALLERMGPLRMGSIAFHLGRAMLPIRRGPMRMGSISFHLGRALSATTTVVDRLVEKGLVDRVADPNDRRAVVCELTETGQQQIAQFWRVGNERLQMVADLLEEDELETVVRGLELLGRADERLQELLASA